MNSPAIRIRAARLPADTSPMKALSSVRMTYEASLQYLIAQLSLTGYAGSFSSITTIHRYIVGPKSAGLHFPFAATACSENDHINPLLRRGFSGPGYPKCKCVVADPAEAVLGHRVSHYRAHGLGALIQSCSTLWVWITQRVIEPEIAVYRDKMARLTPLRAMIALELSQSVCVHADGKA